MMPPSPPFVRMPSGTRSLPVLIITCLVVGALALSGCARRSAAPIDDRRGPPVSTVPPPPPTPPIVVTPPPPAEPEIVVKPAAPPVRVETRPIGAEPSKPGAPVPAPQAGVRTEPRAFKVPYSDENLAIVQRGEDPRRVAKPEAPKPEAAKPGAPAVPPPVVAEAPKPEAPAAKPEAPKPGAATDPDRVDWAWPSAGRVVDKFEGNSKGLGIAGRVGEPVLAAAAGRVVYSGSGLRGYGQLVIIKHNDTYLSAYAHNSRILVKEGQTVTRGQKIAEVGSTDTDRPKLHFEIRRSGKPVDPLVHLPER